MAALRSDNKFEKSPALASINALAHETLHLWLAEIFIDVASVDFRLGALPARDLC